MKKSVRINLLVITIIVAVFTFAGIWYLRPDVPNELLEQARTRQLQPLLEIAEPIRKPVAEPIAQQAVDKKALAAELLPTLTDQVSRSLEGPLYEKLKKEFASDEAFVAQISAKLEETLNLGMQKEADAGTPAIPSGLQEDFAQQIDSVRTELLASLAEGQSSFFSEIEGMVDTRLDSFDKDLQEYVPQIVDRMIPSLVVMLVEELKANKDIYLPYLAQELQAHQSKSITEDDLLVLYASYRDQIVKDLVPAILTAMEEPAKEEVAEMVKTIKTPAVAPTPPAVAVDTKVSSVPMPPTAGTIKTVALEPETLLEAPTFSLDEPEVFVDPVDYEQKRTEIRTKAIQDVLDRIQTL